jgi:hypothetical protein
MASKNYAYYIKGNKFGLVEQERTSGGGKLAIAHCTLSGYTTKDTCEAAGGQWIPSSSGSLSNYDKYISPRSSVTNGIEIEYTYSPIYNHQSTGTEGTDLHRFIGWGSDGTNLLLFTYGASTQTDLSSLFSADDYIIISGSGRWSGLHQVKSAGTSTGILTLKTLCNLKPSLLTNVQGGFATDETYEGASADHKMNIEAFKDAQAKNITPYVFIAAAADTPNNGFFSLSSDSTSGRITFSNKITIDADGDYTSTAAAISAEDPDTIHMYNAFYDEMTVYEGVEVMQDESFDLDVTSYQAKAIVYYLKAKTAEDKADIKGREFFMREFKRQLEKGASTKKRGPHIIQGNNIIRMK